MLLQIDGHGNFGSVDNDPAAAMRYTECRLQPFSSATFLADLDADTVDFSPNFDASQVPCATNWCPTVSACLIACMSRLLFMSGLSAPQRHVTALCKLLKLLPAREAILQ